MNDQITITHVDHDVGHAFDYDDEPLPTWLQLLTASFPKVKGVSEATFLAYELAFDGEDADVMTRAIIRAVRAHEFHTWPTIGEIGRHVDEIKFEDEWSYRGPNGDVPFHVWHRDTFAQDNWSQHEPCGELTPDVNDCPFCADIRAIENEIEGD